MAEETPQEKKEDKTLLQKIGGVLLDFGEWLAETLGQERALKALVDDMGLDLKTVPTYPKPTLSSIKAYVAEPNPNLEAWIGVIADIRKLYESIRAIIDAIDLGAEATAEEATQTLIDLLASNYVRERWFHLFVWMEFARFSTEPMTLYGPNGTAGERFYGSLKALIKFVFAPLKMFGGPDKEVGPAATSILGPDYPGTVKSGGKEAFANALRSMGVASTPAFRSRRFLFSAARPILRPDRYRWLYGFARRRRCGCFAGTATGQTGEQSFSG